MYRLVMKNILSLSIDILYVVACFIGAFVLFTAEQHVLTISLGVNIALIVIFIVYVLRRWLFISSKSQKKKWSNDLKDFSFALLIISYLYNLITKM